MQKKRFLILANRIPYPLTDGGNLAMNAMIAGYLHAGKEVYLLAMHTTRHPVPAERLANLYKDIFAFSTVDIDNSVHLIGTLKNFLFSRKPNHAERFYHASFQKKLAEVLETFKPEVIQIESVFLSTYVPFIKKHSSAILVLRVHNIEYQVWQGLAKETKNIFKRFYLNDLARRMRRFEVMAWQQYDLLLPITGTDADVISAACVKTKRVVAPYGLEAINNLPGLHGKWEAYHIGAMDWVPNAEAINWFLHDIWPAIRAAVPDFRFSFAGRYMPDSFKNFQIEGVTCAGEVPDANAFIADKKILIVPLKAGGGIRIKILEAMAAARIVISTDTGMQGIEAQAGTHYLAANKAEDFVKAIIWCLDHKAEAEQISINAFSLIKSKYEQGAIMQKVLEEIERVEH